MGPLPAGAEASEVGTLRFGAVVPAAVVPAVVVALGFGSVATEGFVGGVLERELAEGLGLIQLNQLLPVPVLLHPAMEDIERHTIPTPNQVLCEKITRMASLPFPDQLQFET